MTHSAHILALATRAFAEQQIDAELSRLARPRRHFVFGRKFRRRAERANDAA